MSQIDAKEISTKLVELTSVLQGLPSTDYARRLHYKTARSRRAAEFRDHDLLDLGAPWPGYDKYPRLPVLGGYPIADRFNYLAQTAVARALERLNSPLQSKIDMAITAEVYTQQMGTMAYLCFVEHLDATLRTRPIDVYDEMSGTKKIYNMRDLRYATWENKPGLSHNVVGDYLKEMLCHVPFIAKIIDEDVARSDHFRSMSILFLADFMRGDPYTAEGPNDFSFMPSLEILEKWSRTLWEIRGKGNPSETKRIVEFCGKAATAVYIPSDASSIPSVYQVTTEVYKKITERDQGNDSYKDEVRKAVKQLVDDDLNTWKSIYTGLSGAWLASAFPLWMDAVKKGLEKNDGAAIKDWIYYGYFWENELPYGSKKMLRPGSAPNGAYIAAGSVVTVADGTFRRVEELKQGDVLLTSVNQAQSTKISREMVPMELTAGLIGFNGEEPFATPAEVFHTTTGLRAVNPHAAMMQNPWAQIGRLAVGHILYRHKERPSAQDKYELVEIKSILRTTPEKRIVFALGLDRGVRSHHVNGYLASLNDPEIRVEDVSALLGKFPPADQLRILSSAKELTPMLSTFDSQTIWDRLQLEMLEAKKSASNPWLVSTYSASYSSLGAHSRVPSMDTISHLARRYILTATDQPQQSPVRRLPQVQLLDGSLLLDGEVQSCTAMNDRTRTVSWTRKTAGTEMYEHGHMEVYPGGEGGSGSILYSSQANPRGLDQGHIARFRAKATSFTSPKDIRKPASFVSSLFSSSKPATTTAVKEGIQIPWDLSFDKKEWKKGETRKEPEKLEKLGTIVAGAITTPEGLTLNTVEIAALDEIRDAINKGRAAAGKKCLERLYTYYVKAVRGKNADGDEIETYRRYIQVHEASTLRFLSDQGPESTSPFNLTFKKNLEIDTKLPVLFQEMYFDISTFGEEAAGALFVHDPTKRENKGSRYYVHGEAVDDPETDADREESRLRVSRHFANIATPGTPTSNDPELQPAGITTLLSAETTPTVERLYSMKYNANDVNSLQQLLINETMFYHMKNKDRENFTTRKTPDGHELGDKLTSQLPSDVRKWLQNVYAPAFITRSITQFEGFKKKFKTGDTEKVWYWWSGNGPKCLSNAEEYNKLNRIAGVQAMKKLYPALLDLDLGTSHELAEKLYKAVSKKRMMAQVLSGGGAPGDAINKIVAILYTLHPERNYADEWFKAVTDYAIAASIELPFLKDGGKYVQDYLRDSIRELITKILSNDPKFTGPVRNKLEEDLREFMKKNNISEKDSLEKKVSACVALMAAFTVEVAKLLAVAGNGLAKAFGGSKLFLLAGKIVEKAENVVSKIPLGTKLARGLGGLCVVGYFVGQVLPLVGVIKSWDKLTPAQRIIGILEPLRAVLNAADKAVQEYEAWRSPDTPTPQRAQESAILDEQLHQTISSPEGNGIFEAANDLNKEGGGVKGAMADRIKEGGLPEAEEHIPGESEIWNEEKSRTPEGLMPHEEEAASKLSTTSKGIRALNIVLGFAVAAAMTYSLIEEWDKLTDVGKFINTLSVVVQILAVVVDVIDLALTTGLIVSSALSVALPVIGAILALIGIGLMIASLFVDMYKKEPVPDPVQDFVDGVANPLIKGWPEPPQPKIAYSFTKDGSKDGKGSVTVIGENKTNKDVSVAYTQMAVLAGHDSQCLFSDESFHLTTDKDAKEGGVLAISPQDTLRPTLMTSLLREGDGSDRKEGKYWVHNLSIKGTRDDKENKMGSIILAKGKSLKAVWAGMLKSSSSIDIMERFTDGDSAHSVLKVNL